MVFQVHQIGCVWKTPFRRSGHNYIHKTCYRTQIHNCRFVLQTDSHLLKAVVEYQVTVVEQQFLVMISRLFRNKKYTYVMYVHMYAWTVCWAYTSRFVFTKYVRILHVYVPCVILNCIQYIQVIWFQNACTVAHIPICTQYTQTCTCTHTQTHAQAQAHTIHKCIVHTLLVY